MAAWSQDVDSDLFDAGSRTRFDICKSPSILGPSRVHHGSIWAQILQEVSGGRQHRRSSLLHLESRGMTWINIKSDFVPLFASYSSTKHIAPHSPFTRALHTSSTMAAAQIVEFNGTAVASTRRTSVNGKCNGKDKAQGFKVKAGMITDVKNLYEGKPDSRNRSTWVDKYPDDLEEAGENDETARYALLIRNKKCYNGRKMLEIDSVVVQSPLLKKALGSILDAYPGITTTLDRLTFEAPFRPFIHRWTNLVAALESEEDPETKSHLDLFHRTMEEELKDDLKARDDYILNKAIT